MSFFQRLRWPSSRKAEEETPASTKKEEDNQRWSVLYGALIDEEALPRARTIQLNGNFVLTPALTQAWQEAQQAPHGTDAAWHKFERLLRQHIVETHLQLGESRATAQAQRLQCAHTPRQILEALVERYIGGALESASPTEAAEQGRIWVPLRIVTLLAHFAPNRAVLAGGAVRVLAQYVNVTTQQLLRRVAVQRCRTARASFRPDNLRSTVADVDVCLCQGTPARYLHPSLQAAFVPEQVDTPAAKTADTVDSDCCAGYGYDPAQCQDSRSKVTSEQALCGTLTHLFRTLSLLLCHDAEWRQMRASPHLARESDELCDLATCAATLLRLLVDDALSNGSPSSLAHAQLECEVMHFCGASSLLSSKARQTLFHAGAVDALMARAVSRLSLSDRPTDRPSDRTADHPSDHPSDLSSDHPRSDHSVTHDQSKHVASRVHSLFRVRRRLDALLCLRHFWTHVREDAWCQSTSLAAPVTPSDALQYCARAGFFDALAADLRELTALPFEGRADAEVAAQLAHVSEALVRLAQTRSSEGRCLPLPSWHVASVLAGVLACSAVTLPHTRSARIPAKTSGHWRASEETRQARLPMPQFHSNEDTDTDVGHDDSAATRLARVMAAACTFDSDTPVRLRHVRVHLLTRYLRGMASVGDSAAWKSQWTLAPLLRALWCGGTDTDGVDSDGVDSDDVDTDGVTSTGTVAESETVSLPTLFHVAECATPSAQSLRAFALATLTSLTTRPGAPCDVECDLLVQQLLHCRHVLHLPRGSTATEHVLTQHIATEHVSTEHVCTQSDHSCRLIACVVARDVCDSLTLALRLGERGAWHHAMLKCDALRAALLCAAATPSLAESERVPVTEARVAALTLVTQALEARAVQRVALQQRQGVSGLLLPLVADDEQRVRAAARRLTASLVVATAASATTTSPQLSDGGRSVTSNSVSASASGISTSGISASTSGISTSGISTSGISTSGISTSGISGSEASCSGELASDTMRVLQSDALQRRPAVWTALLVHVVAGSLLRANEDALPGVQRLWRRAGLLTALPQCALWTASHLPPDACLLRVLLCRSMLLATSLCTRQNPRYQAMWCEQGGPVALTQLFLARLLPKNACVPECLLWDCVRCACDADFCEKGVVNDFALDGSALVDAPREQIQPELVFSDGLVSALTLLPHAETGACHRLLQWLLRRTATSPRSRFVGGDKPVLTQLLQLLERPDTRRFREDDETLYELQLRLFEHVGSRRLTARHLRRFLAIVKQTSEKRRVQRLLHTLALIVKEERSDPASFLQCDGESSGLLLAPLRQLPSSCALSLWFLSTQVTQSTELTQSDTSCLVSLLTQDGTQGVEIYVADDGLRIVLRFRETAADEFVVPFVESDTTSTRRWCHVVLSLSPPPSSSASLRQKLLVGSQSTQPLGTQVRVFVDGAQRLCATASSCLRADTPVTRCFYGTDSFGKAFRGQLGTLALFERALNEAHAEVIYARGADYTACFERTHETSSEVAAELRASVALWLHAGAADGDYVLDGTPPDRQAQRQLGERPLHARCLRRTWRFRLTNATVLLRSLGGVSLVIVVLHKWAQLLRETDGGNEKRQDEEDTLAALLRVLIALAHEDATLAQMTQLRVWRALRHLLSLVPSQYLTMSVLECVETLVHRAISVDTDAAALLLLTTATWLHAPRPVALHFARVLEDTVRRHRRRLRLHRVRDDDGDSDSSVYLAGIDGVQLLLDVFRTTLWPCEAPSQWSRDPRRSQFEVARLRATSVDDIGRVDATVVTQVRRAVLRGLDLVTRRGRLLRLRQSVAVVRALVLPQVTRDADALLRLVLAWHARGAFWDSHAARTRLHDALLSLLPLEHLEQSTRALVLSCVTRSMLKESLSETPLLLPSLPPDMSATSYDSLVCMMKGTDAYADARRFSTVLGDESLRFPTALVAALRLVARPGVQRALRQRVLRDSLIAVRGLAGGARCAILDTFGWQALLRDLVMRCLVEYGRDYASRSESVDQSGGVPVCAPSCHAEVDASRWQKDTVLPVDQVLAEQVPLPPNTAAELAMQLLSSLSLSAMRDRVADGWHAVADTCAFLCHAPSPAIVLAMWLLRDLSAMLRQFHDTAGDAAYNAIDHNAACASDALVAFLHFRVAAAAEYLKSRRRKRRGCNVPHTALWCNDDTNDDDYDDADFDDDVADTEDGPLLLDEFDVVGDDSEEDAAAVPWKPPHEIWAVWPLIQHIVTLQNWRGHLREASRWRLCLRLCVSLVATAEDGGDDHTLCLLLGSAESRFLVSLLRSHQSAKVEKSRSHRPHLVSEAAESDTVRRQEVDMCLLLLGTLLRLLRRLCLRRRNRARQGVGVSPALRVTCMRLLRVCRDVAHIPTVWRALSSTVDNVPVDFLLPKREQSEDDWLRGVATLMCSREWTRILDFGPLARQTNMWLSTQSRKHVDFERRLTDLRRIVTEATRSEREEAQRWRRRITTLRHELQQRELERLVEADRAHKRQLRLARRAQQEIVAALSLDERSPWCDEEKAKHARRHWRLDERQTASGLRLRLVPDRHGTDHAAAHRRTPSVTPTSEARSMQSVPPDDVAGQLGEHSRRVRQKASGTEPGSDAPEPESDAPEPEQQADPDEDEELSDEAKDDDDTLVDDTRRWRFRCVRVQPLKVTPGTLELTPRDVAFFADPDFTYNKRGDMHVIQLFQETRAERKAREEQASIRRRIFCRKQDDAPWKTVDMLWPLSDLVSTQFRRWQLRHCALEVFGVSGRSALFAVADRRIQRKVVKQIWSLRPPLMPKPQEEPNVSKLTQRWRERRLSNFEYLMRLNQAAGRTFNDLSQYPVVPWVLADYESERIDLRDAVFYRDLSLPVGALDEACRERCATRYSEMRLMQSDDLGGDPPFHHGSHYSNLGAVIGYLIRLEPFTSLHVQLQSGKFDVPDRLFFSVAKTWQGVLHNAADSKELVPEFFSLPAFLRCTNPGLKLHAEKADHDVALPPWAHSAEHFVRVQRLAMESEHVSATLHHWIDLVFGDRQSGPRAEEACNVFHHLTYESHVQQALQQIGLYVEESNESEDPMKQLRRNALLAQVDNFGQCPRRLFHEAHAPRHSLRRVLASRVMPLLSLALPGTAHALSNVYEPEQDEGDIGAPSEADCTLLRRHMSCQLMRHVTRHGVDPRGRHLHNPVLCVTHLSGSVVTIAADRVVSSHLFRQRSTDESDDGLDAVVAQEDAPMRTFVFEEDVLAMPRRPRLGVYFSRRVSPLARPFAVSNHGVAISAQHWDGSFRATRIASDAADTTSDESGDRVITVTLHDDICTCVAVCDHDYRSVVAVGSADTTVSLWRLIAPDQSDHDTDQSGSSTVTHTGGHTAGDLGSAAVGLRDVDDAADEADVNVASDSEDDTVDDGHRKTATRRTRRRRVGAMRLLPLHRLRGHDDVVLSIDVSVDLDMVASGAIDGVVLLHALHTGDYVRAISVTNDEGSRVSADLVRLTVGGGVLVFSASDNVLRVFGGEGQLLTKVNTGERIHDAILSSDGEFVVTGGQRGRVTVRALFDLSEVASFDDAPAAINTLAWSAHELHLLAGTAAGQLLVYGLSDTERPRQRTLMTDLGF